MIGRGETGGVGATGNKGSAGPMGDTETVITLTGGGIIQVIAGNASSYVFAGTPLVTFTNAMQKIFVWGEIPVALLQSSAKQNVNIGAGYQPQAGGVIKNMVANLYSYVEVGTERHIYAIASLVTPGAGTWKIGAVVSNTGPSNITNNDYVNLI